MIRYDYGRINEALYEDYPRDIFQLTLQLFRRRNIC